MLRKRQDRDWRVSSLVHTTVGGEAKPMWCCIRCSASCMVGLMHICDMF